MVEYKCFRCGYSTKQKTHLINHLNSAWGQIIPNLNNLNTQELRIARNTVFAYYGRPFASEDLKNYFSEQAWYSINYQYDDNLISPDHKELINRVKKMESKKPVLSTDEEGGGSEDAKIKKAYNQFVKNNNHIKKNIKQYIRKCIKDGSLNMKDVVDFFSEKIFLAFCQSVFIGAFFFLCI